MSYPDISYIDFKTGAFKEERVKNWPQTSTLTLKVSGYHFDPIFDKSSTWPSTTISGGREVIGNLVVIHHEGCQWIAQGFEWQPKDMFPRDFGYICNDIKLKSGTKIGVMIAGVFFFGMKTIEERTSIAWTTLTCR